MDMEDCGHGMEVPGQDSGTTACVCLISKNKVKICNRLSIFRLFIVLLMLGLLCAVDRLVSFLYIHFKTIS